MDAFLKTLQTLPEVAELVSRVENGGCPAVLTGTQPVQRACVGAAVAAGAGRPMVFLCADEREARQLAGDLQSLTGETPVTLLAREWQFRPNAVSSREWERSRLAALHQMAAGNAPIVVATVDALLARTMPPHRLAELSVTLEVGGRADLKELTDRLLQAGYSRCDQVEGVGQFALRGGILDVFSPLMEQPVRCEFFDDEIDSLGAFDPGTQRRTENVSSALLLPAAEALPGLAPGGLTHLAEQIEKLAVKYAKKENGEKIAQTLRGDAERFRSGAEVNGLDRYLGLIYPDAAGGADYLPPDAVVFLCEGGRIEQRVKTVLLQLHQDTEALMEAGLMAGDAAEVCLSGEALFARLADFPVVMLDALPTSRHPMKPRSLLAISARQLSSYGGSLETAVTEHRQRRSGTLRRRGAGQQPAAAAGRAEHPGGAGSERRRHARPRPAADHRRGPVRRLRMAGAEAGGADGGPADGPHPEKAETEKGLQPPEAAILYRSLPRGSGGACAPRHRPLRGHPADAGGRRGERLYQN